MRVLVCGGRDYAERDVVFGVLDALKEEHGDIVIIHGAANGADQLAQDWAWENGVPYVPYPANWDKHGKKAGPMRNRQMLIDGKPEYFVAFPGGKGTAHMVSLLKRAGVPGTEI